MHKRLIACELKCLGKKYEKSNFCAIIIIIIFIIIIIKEQLLIHCKTSLEL